jgi:signal transduction histidine kinase
VILVERATEELVLSAWRGLTAEQTQQRRQPLGDSVSSWVVRSREPLLLINGFHDDRFRGVKKRIKDSMCVPMVFEEDVLGVLSVNNCQGEGHFSDEDLQMLCVLANQCAIAVRNAQLYEQVRRQGQDLQYLLAQIVSAQEDERRRVAMDIHDGPAQTLYSVLYRLQTCRALLQKDLDRGLRRLETLEQTARQSLQEVRELICELRPPLLDDLGLLAAMQQYVDKFAADTGVAVNFVSQIRAQVPDPAIQTALFRILQEALNNVRKHAVATRVEVRLDADETEVRALVADDGRGFELAQSCSSNAPGHHLGLAGMRERAEMFRGSVQVQSQPGNGTTILVRMPIQEGD